MVALLIDRRFHRGIYLSRFERFSLNETSGGTDDLDSPCHFSKLRHKPDILCIPNSPYFLLNSKAAAR